jgi:hypothetical protein
VVVNCTGSFLDHVGQHALIPFFLGHCINHRIRACCDIIEFGGKGTQSKKKRRRRRMWQMMEREEM